jgi:sirohydrochlorin ferrochelatase
MWMWIDHKKTCLLLPLLLLTPLLLRRFEEILTRLQLQVDLHMMARREQTPVSPHNTQIIQTRTFRGS